MTKFSPKQSILFAVPGLISSDVAIANHPFGYGGGIFVPGFLNRLA